jgi:hypothetical protein
MADEPNQTLVALRDRREQVIARLSEAFARDALELEEFERRLALAHRAEAVAELEPLVADLGAATTTALVPAPSATPERVRDRGTVAAVFGGAVRRGTWTPARHLRVVTVMGGAELDFRDAVFAPGVTEVHITTVMGGVQLIVPPTLAVEMEGIAIMGGFEQAERAPARVDPERPLLRVTGLALMGGVHIETRLPGESAGQANRRRRKERKALRKAEKQGLLPAPRDGE